MKKKKEPTRRRTTYRIIRFKFGYSPEVIKGGLTLKEVQAHYKREDTHGPGWFDGYELEHGAHQ